MSWIILIGQRACGKTSIGVELASHFDLDFVDLDHEIERKEKKKIAEIFEVFGEKYFRRLELKNLLSLPKKQMILSGGGGLVTQPDAVSFLKQRGKIIHIKVSKNDLMVRRENDKTRPLLNGSNSVREEIENSFKIREKLYTESSDIQIDCSSLSFEESIKKIQDRLMLEG
jgi:shikimate kinase